MIKKIKALACMFIYFVTFKKYCLGTCKYCKL